MEVAAGPGRLTRPATGSAPRVRPAFAWGPVAGAMLVVGAVLTLLSEDYGYHRDELYFKMLPPAWGYVDQPPLTPLLARAATELFGESATALRVPATLSLLAAIVMVALLARELGGGRTAQTLAAWGFGTAATPLIFGHTLLTASLDLVVWPAVVLLVARALLRDEPRWWIAAGVVAGAGLYNKLLVVVLLGAIVVGLLVAGPRRPLATRWPWLGAATAAVVGLPNLVYQATNGWPQLAMGAALSEANADDVRVDMWPFQLVTLGFGLTVVWIVGLVALWRRPQWRPLRFLVVAYPVVLIFVFAGGTQIYYAVGLVTVLYAAGCVVVGDWLASRPSRRSRVAWQFGVVALVVTNAVPSALIGLPLVPVDALGQTPIGEINQTARDAVGWEAYVAQVAEVYDALPPQDREDAVIVTLNYGEAGALAVLGREHGLPWPYSGHNELHRYGPPPREARVAVVIGGSAVGWSRFFESCTTEGVLDNGVGVDNEEQGRDVAVCRAPIGGWAAVWPELAHLD